ncbi:MAG: AAA family ATPase [Bacilli bacterium]|jgi:predicted AAA+ superfamily ATPase|nr:AAA family ATPase [Bacilli bacterium]
MLKRKVYDDILEWNKSSENKVLLIDGPRQVGKSFIIREFGKNSFQNYIEINLILSKEARILFSDIKSIDDFILKLSLLTQTPLEEGKTLIFLDEIQTIKENDIITLSKFMVSQTNYRFVLSGSLLGVELQNVQSWPTGYMKIIKMHPLDFEEFMWAFRTNEQIIHQLHKSFHEMTPVDSFIHEKIMELFRLYLIIGGMPQAVVTYLETKNIQKVNDTINDINMLYKKDISQYSQNSKFFIEEIYDLIPSEMNSKNKRFILKKLNENVKFRKYEQSFIWLSKAGVTIPVFNVDNPVTPLLLSKKRTLFKLFHIDNGMLINMSLDPKIQIQLLTKEKNINFGAYYENVVAKELYSHGFERLYFLNNKNLGEVDFLIENEDGVLPIEVKSGKDYERHNALSNLLANPEFKIKKSFIFQNDNVMVKDNRIYLPIYMITFLKRNSNQAFETIDFDFSEIQNL